MSQVAVDRRAVLRIVNGLSITIATRLTRSRAVSGCQVTSTKWQPNECLESFGFGAKAVISELPLPVIVVRWLVAATRRTEGLLRSRWT